MFLSCTELREVGGVRAGGKAKRPRAEFCIAEQHLQPPCHDFSCLSLPVFLPLNQVGTKFHASFEEISLSPKDWGRMQGGIKSSWLISSLGGVEELLPACSLAVPALLARRAGSKGRGWGSCHATSAGRWPGVGAMALAVAQPILGQCTRCTHGVTPSSKGQPPVITKVFLGHP